MGLAVGCACGTTADDPATPAPEATDSCPDGTLAVGAALCVSPVCGDALWPEVRGLPEPVVHVLPEAPGGGAGTPNDPVSTLAAARELLAGGPGTIALAAGAYPVDADWVVDQERAVVGVCAEAVTLQGPAEGALVTVEGDLHLADVSLADAHEGLRIDGGAASLASVALSETREAGVRVYEGSLEATGLTITDAVGAGVFVGDDASRTAEAALTDLTVRRLTLDPNTPWRGALTVQGRRASATARGLYLQPGGAAGIYVDNHGRLEVQVGSAEGLANQISDAAHFGVLVFGEGSMATLHGLAVTGVSTTSDAASLYGVSTGVGIAAISGATVEASDVRVAETVGLGVWAQTRARLSLTDCEIRRAGTDAMPESLPVGALVHFDAEVSLLRCTLAENYAGGVLVAGTSSLGDSLGGTVELHLVDFEDNVNYDVLAIGDGAWVQGGNVSSVGVGADRGSAVAQGASRTWSLGVAEGGQLRLGGVEIADAYQSGVLAYGAGSHIGLHTATVTGVSADRLGELGHGIEVFDEATAELRDVVVEDVREHGVIVSDARLVAQGLEVRRVTRSAASGVANGLTLQSPDLLGEVPRIDWEPELFVAPEAEGCERFDRAANEHVVVHDATISDIEGPGVHLYSLRFYGCSIDIERTQLAGLAAIGGSFFVLHSRIEDVDPDANFGGGVGIFQQRSNPDLSSNLTLFSNGSIRDTHLAAIYLRSDIAAPKATYELNTIEVAAPVLDQRGMEMHGHHVLVIGTPEALAEPWINNNVLEGEPEHHLFLSAAEGLYIGNAIDGNTEVGGEADALRVHWQDCAGLTPPWIGGDERAACSEQRRRFLLLDYSRYFDVALPEL